MRLQSHLYSCKCDMTRSTVWHNSFTNVTWLIYTHLYMQHDSFIRVTLLNHMCDVTHACVVELIHMSLALCLHICMHTESGIVDEDSFLQCGCIWVLHTCSHSARQSLHWYAKSLHSKSLSFKESSFICKTLSCTVAAYEDSFLQCGCTWVLWLHMNEDSVLHCGCIWMKTQACVVAAYESCIVAAYMDENAVLHCDWRRSLALWLHMNEDPALHCEWIEPYVVAAYEPRLGLVKCLHTSGE